MERWNCCTFSSLKLVKIRNKWTWYSWIALCISLWIINQSGESIYWGIISYPLHSNRWRPLLSSFKVSTRLSATLSYCLSINSSICVSTLKFVGWYNEGARYLKQSCLANSARLIFFLNRSSQVWFDVRANITILSIFGRRISVLYWLYLC